MSDGLTSGAELQGRTVAGKYRIRRLVGLGGMGAVYEGEHVELGKRIAIKIIDHASAQSSELAARFKREARAASAVESEHIVQVFDVGRDPEVGLYMVMEFLHGADLELRLRNEAERRLEPVACATIAYQVARALVKAHGARVIHRDLKPANIFLTEREDGSLRVKVLDFGISKLLEGETGREGSGKKEGFELTQEGVALGTPQYMSPEQAQGLTTIDHRTDLWSLGAVLYEMLAGVPAFPELPTYEEVIMKILLEPPPPIQRVAPWVPDALAAVVRDALQKDAAKRIPDAQEFARRLVQAVPEVAIGASGPHHAARASLPSLNGLTPLGRRPLTPASVHTTKKTPVPHVTADDTQVVIRATASISSSPPPSDDRVSETMLAPKVPRDGAPRIIVRESAPGSAPGSAPRSFAPEEPKTTPNLAPPPDDSAESARAEADDAGEPTMFQPPAWVGALEKEGPTTMKTGVAVRSVEHDGGARSPRNVATAALTALGIVLVGSGILLATSVRGTGGARPSETLEPTGAGLSSAAPPSVDTNETPSRAAPPSTGVGELLSVPPPGKAGMAAARAAADGGAPVRLPTGASAP